MGKKEDNLTPFDSNQSREEAAKNGRKGGIASGEARRRKKTAKQAAELILNLAPTENNGKNLSILGVDEDDQTNMVALIARMFTKAMAHGDVRAAEFLIDIVGGNDISAVEHERLKIEKKRLAMDEGKQQGGDDVVSAWVSEVMDNEGEDGDE